MTYTTLARGHEHYSVRAYEEESRDQLCQAFFKSTNTIPAYFPASRPFSQSSVDFNRAVVVEWWALEPD